MQPFNVIVKPLLSEKSNELREAQSKYVFIVRRDATKADVKKAKALWDVDVASVRTLIQRGKCVDAECRSVSRRTPKRLL